MNFHGYMIVQKMDHVIVLKDDKFQFSADNVTEAKQFISEELNL